MSAFKLLAAAAILSAISAPSVAQQVISEPGYCAFFYPNANCQNKGPGNPYTGGYYTGTGGYHTGGYRRSFADQGTTAIGPTVGTAPAKRRAHRAARRPQ